MKRGAHYHCPVNGWDCPHYKDHEIIEGNEEFCLCKIPGNPYEECDDFCMYDVHFCFLCNCYNVRRFSREDDFERWRYLFRR